MSDLISRQSAINAADSTDYTGLAIEDVKKVTDEVIKALKQLPSVQPEQPEWVQTVERWYNKALCKPYIQKPIAWALYQAWKEYNNE